MFRKAIGNNALPNPYNLTWGKIMINSLTDLAYALENLANIVRRVDGFGIEIDTLSKKINEETRVRASNGSRAHERLVELETIVGLFTPDDLDEMVKRKKEYLEGQETIKKVMSRMEGADNHAGVGQAPKAEDNSPFRIDGSGKPAPPF